MNQDEIIKMARDSGMELYGLGKDRARFVHHLEAFANLVAAKALAQPEQDSTCSITLRLQGKPYPRTCKKCGLGPCIAQPMAQPEQEPVAWRTFDGEGGYDYRSYEDNESYADDWDKRNPNHKGWVDKLYTRSQRTWVGLTDVEIDVIYEQIKEQGWAINYARAIEAKLKERNDHSI